MLSLCFITIHVFLCVFCFCCHFLVFCFNYHLLLLLLFHLYAVTPLLLRRHCCVCSHGYSCDFVVGNNFLFARVLPPFRCCVTPMILIIQRRLSNDFRYKVALSLSCSVSISSLLANL